jgi:hypothetical protein
MRDHAPLVRVYGTKRLGGRLLLLRRVRVQLREREERSRDV